MKTTKIHFVLLVAFSMLGTGLWTQAQNSSRKTLLKPSKPKEITSRAALKRYQWVLVQLSDAQGNARVSGQKIFLQVDPSLKSIGGNGGCNVFGGDLKATARVLKIGPLMSTKMYCDEASRLENRFLEILDGEKTYKISGRKLTIRGQKPNTVLVFMARPRQKN
ncbi:MAG: META domain-containing protein [Bacteroidetes Order II. Incertae sedis bacterium]|nr:META domain-containing protein [Bacteroidetes Order II. bacterium]